MRVACCVVMALATWTAGAGAASADLIEADLSSVGDGLLTRDTEERLEWLDLTQTSNLSYDTVVAGAWYGLGFEHATLTQVETLFDHSGANITLNERSAWNRWGVSSLLDLVGDTSYFDSQLFGAGFVATTDASGDHYQPYYLMYTVLSTEGYLRSPGLAYSSTTAMEQAGHYLVRSYAVIPEPSTLALLGLGVALLGPRLARRRAD